jgi:hypothetical protein
MRTRSLDLVKSIVVLLVVNRWQRAIRLSTTVAADDQVPGCAIAFCLTSRVYFCVGELGCGYDEVLGASGKGDDEDDRSGARYRGGEYQSSE